MRIPGLAASVCGISLMLFQLSFAAEGPPIRTLTDQEVRDLVAGSAIVATRGNYRPIAAIIRRTVDKLLTEGKPFRMIALEDLPDDWTVVAPATRIGGGNPWPHVIRRMRDQRVPTVPSADRQALALDALERSAGRQVDAVIRSEAAGATVGAFQAAIERGVPVVDACPTGRAVPEVTQSIPNIAGISPAPAAIVSRWGDVVVIEKAAGHARIEDIARSVAVASGGAVLMSGTVMSGAQARQALIPGSLSQNILYGKAVREARERGEDPVAALVKVANGYRLFHGIVTGVKHNDDRGFDWWDVTLDGVGDFKGHVYRVWVKNENIVSWLDGKPDAMSPDLISPLDPETGEAILTTELGGYSEGDEIVMVGIPAPAQWRTQQGIELLGPRHFGFDFDYVPLETLHR